MLPSLFRTADLLVLPQVGIGAVVALTDPAQATLRIKMFTFDSPALIEAAGRASRRGVTI